MWCIYGIILCVRGFCACQKYTKNISFEPNSPSHNTTTTISDMTSPVPVAVDKSAPSLVGWSLFDAQMGRRIDLAGAARPEDVSVQRSYVLIPESLLLLPDLVCAVLCYLFRDISLLTPPPQRLTPKNLSAEGTHCSGTTRARAHTGDPVAGVRRHAPPRH